MATKNSCWSPSTITSFDRSSIGSSVSYGSSQNVSSLATTLSFNDSSNGMNRTDIEELLRWVRNASPYYRNLYSKLPPCGDIPLCEYPIVDLKSFWAVPNPQTSQVLTMPHIDGIIFKSGGTTAEPKIVFYTKQELQIASQQLSLGIHSAGLRTGDRIANLFHLGDLYGSFLLHVLSITYIPTPAVHLPIGGFTGPPTTAALLNDFSATVIFAGVTTVSATAEYLVSANTICPSIRIIMFSGEAFYSDQKSLIKRAFPNAVCRSLAYGSMDAGVIGTSVAVGPAEEDDGAAHIHEACEPFIYLEIVPNNSLMPTAEEHVPGKILVTNMTRRLMPIVRYPSGDRGEWIDYKRRIFRLLGRDRKPIKLGMISLDFTELRECVGRAMVGFMIGGVQAVFGRRYDGKQIMTIKVAFNLPSLENTEGIEESFKSNLPMLKARMDARLGKIVFEPDMDQARKKVLEQIYETKPVLKEHASLGLVAPVRVEFVGMVDFWVNLRTGKIADVFDERSGGVDGEEISNPFES